MHNRQLINLLYARQTLRDLTSPWRDKHLPKKSGPGALVQAQILFERGKDVKARTLLVDLVTHAQESRVTLWASKALRDLGLWPEGPMAIQAQGVVIEVPMEESKDILAIYRDNSVRFFSHSGAVGVYESAGNQAIDHLCQQTMTVADHITATTRKESFSDEMNSPHATVLTLSGEVHADTEGTNALMSLGAELIKLLTPQ